MRRKVRPSRVRLSDRCWCGDRVNEFLVLRTADGWLFGRFPVCFDHRLLEGWSQEARALLGVEVGDRGLVYVQDRAGTRVFGSVASEVWAH